MKLPSKKIHIRTIKELRKRRWDLFDYEIWIPREEFHKMDTELNMSLVAQMNCFEFEEEIDVKDKSL